jgi:hypothetical protein
MRISVSRAIYDGPRYEQAGANPPGICGSLCRVGIDVCGDPIRYTAFASCFVSGLRYGVAGAASMAYLLLRRRLVWLSGGDWWRVTLLGILMFTINMDQSPETRLQSGALLPLQGTIAD